jgi:MarR family transcriptional regulator, negative regulator of the multidrug operon emrRAB
MYIYVEDLQATLDLVEREQPPFPPTADSRSATTTAAAGAPLSSGVADAIVRYMRGAYNAASVANRLGALALTLSDSIREATEQATGMTGGIPAALISLHEWAEGSPVDTLADAIHLSHSRAVRVVDRLEEAGLGRREPDPSDGRRALVWLTDDGRELAERALEARSTVLGSAVAGLSTAALRDLDHVVTALLGVAAVDAHAARRTCRLCDAHACGHYEGSCPVTQAADRSRAPA